MQTATYGELFKYYKEKKKDKLYNHFLTLFRSGMADSLHFEFNQKEVKLFITLLWRYSKYLTFKDFLYYNKHILTKYSYGMFNK
jgi:hypothetical protein